MKVLITGATGLAGAHTAAALHARGFGLRLLVRNPERIDRALAPLGLHDIEHLVGDVTDKDTVKRALEGCDAVVHSAALYTMDTRRAAEVQLTNVVGSQLVLDNAAHLGLDPIIHISSVAALFPPDGEQLTPETSVKRPRDMYACSKANAERIARRLQERGAPITIVYPGQIWGPHDPTFNDGIQAMMGFVRHGLFPATPGGVPMIDVRDLAAVVAAAMQPGRGPRRYMAGGHFLSFGDVGSAVAGVTGRRIRCPRVPGAAMRFYGRVADFAAQLFGVNLGPSHDAMVTLTRGVPCDDSRTLQELGVRPRPIEETLRDTLRWMLDRELVPAEVVGRVAE